MNEVTVVGIKQGEPDTRIRELVEAPRPLEAPDAWQVASCGAEGEGGPEALQEDWAPAGSEAGPETDVGGPVLAQLPMLLLLGPLGPLGPTPDPVWVTRGSQTAWLVVPMLGHLLL